MWPFDKGESGNAMFYRQHSKEPSCEKSLQFYFRRPLIYFCFGLPIGAPSICLILLSSVEEGLTTGLIIGCLLLTAGTASVVTGTILGLLSCRKNNPFKDNVKQRNSLISAGADSTLGMNSPSDALSRSSFKNPSQASNSRTSSTASVNTATNGLSNMDKSKLIKLKRKTMRRKRKRGVVKFNSDVLPPLTEEDPMTSKTLSRGSTSNNFAADLLSKNDNIRKPNVSNMGIVSKDLNTTANNILKSVQANGNNSSYNSNHHALKSDNIENLKDYLSAIGLGSDKNKELQSGLTSRSVDEQELVRNNSIDRRTRFEQIRANDFPLSSR